MERSRLLLLLPLLLLVPLLWAMKEVGRQPLTILSRYPQTPAFEKYRFHLSSEHSNPLKGNGALLTIGSPLVAGFGVVKEIEIIGGQLSRTGWNFSGSSSRHGFTTDLKPSQLAAIERLMLQLPPSSPPENRDNLVVVTLYQPRPVELRLYDRANLPQVVRDIFKITGAPLQELR